MRWFRKSVMTEGSSVTLPKTRNVSRTISRFSWKREWVNWIEIVEMTFSNFSWLFLSSAEITCASPAVDDAVAVVKY